MVGKRTGRPVAAAQDVGTDDKEFVGINRLARADVEIPPAGTPGLRVEAGDMGRARQGVADENGVVAAGGEFAQGLIGDLDLIKGETGLDFDSAQRERFGCWSRPGGIDNPWSSDPADRLAQSWRACPSFGLHFGADDTVASIDGSMQRLVNVRLDVRDIFQADGQPHIVRRHAGLLLLGRGQLLVGGRGGMNDQAIWRRQCWPDAKAI